jgi:beta-glucosidase
MCAYNRVNQTGACRNRELLDGVLKEELDFQGFVLSDWAALEDLEGSVIGGVDVNMPGVFFGGLLTLYQGFTHFLYPF